VTNHSLRRTFASLAYEAGSLPRLRDGADGAHGLGARALIALVGAVPLIARLRKAHMPTVAVCAIFATVLVALAAGRAGGDAFIYQHSNCWTISKSGDADRGGLVEIIECTPDGESGSSRLCEQLRTSSSHGTVWRCETENF
jgi:hypothetical protein